MRYLKIFNSKSERNAALLQQKLHKNSVTIWGKDAVDKSDGKIEYGVGNGDHQINLGYNDVDNDYDDNNSTND